MTDRNSLCAESFRKPFFCRFGFHLRHKVYDEDGRRCWMCRCGSVHYEVVDYGW